MERETFEFYEIKFQGHPNLKSEFSMQKEFGVSSNAETIPIER